ncbi:hypothetical protein HGA88_02460 [Candidatus Roizmanbacteria bacterium]|nr:hypothetical protein [Candidatus Roizmanbacteria bacterium]
MDIAQFTQFNGKDIINLFIKGFFIVFAIIYLLYAVVLSRQTKVMNATVNEPIGVFFNLGSLIQAFVGFLLLGLAIILT